MADQLWFSLWIRDFSPENMLRHFGKLLGAFPLSRLRPGISALSIYALEFTEPPLAGHSYAEGAEIDSVLESAGEFLNADCAYLAEAWWELWQFDGEWRLRPSPVSLECYGPEFANDLGDHLRIGLGRDSWFLPQPEIPGSGITIQSNMKALVRVVEDVSAVLPLVRRRLWLESGEDFGARLEAGLERI